MQRFYNQDFPVLEKIFISKDKDFINQLTKVLRSKPWDKIILFNWKDNFDYIYEISHLEKRSVLLNKLEKIEKEKNNKFEINLFQAFVNKLSKIELILQKWVEVWINNFYFFSWERSQYFPISENKKERFKKIIIEAIEQSGQNKIPSLNFSEINFEEKNTKNLNLFFHTKNNNSKTLNEIKIKNYEKINIFVWPEWGFSETEINNFLQKDFTQVYLWKNILRAETVWIALWFYFRQK